MSTPDDKLPMELAYAETVEIPSTLIGNGELVSTDQIFKIPMLAPKRAKIEQRPIIKPKIEPVSPGYGLQHTLEGHQRFVTAVRFCPAGDWLTSASVDGSLKIWDTETVQLKQSLSGHIWGVNDVAWSPNGKFIASSSDDKTVMLWDPLTGRCQMVLNGHTRYVFACSINPEGNLIASASFDCTVRLWDVRNGKTLKTIPAHNDPISSVDFNRDGSLFVTGSFDGLVRIWDTVSGQVLKTLIDEDNSPVGYVKFAPNGRYILASYLNSQIKLWNFQKPKCLRIYKGHANLRFCIPAKFSVTAGMWIVSGSEDNALYIWGLQSKELVQKIDAHSSGVIAIDCHPKLNLIATAALQDTDNLKIWQSTETVIELNK